MVLLKLLELILAIFTVVRIVECVDKLLPTKPKGVGPWVNGVWVEFWRID